MEETKVELPCVVDGQQDGTYMRALKTDGTLVYIFDETRSRVVSRTPAN